MASNDKEAQRTEMIERRAGVAADYRRGVTQSALAKKYRVTQATISTDLKAIRKEWQESALIDFDAAKAAELARIDTLESEYWSAWDESRKKRIKKRGGKKEESGITVRRGNRQVEVPGKSVSMSQVDETERDGNPAFLAGVQWCIEQRCKIFGLYAPTRLAGHDGGPLPTPPAPQQTINMSVYSLAELRMLDRLLAKQETANVIDGQAAPAA